MGWSQLRPPWESRRLFGVLPKQGCQGESIADETRRDEKGRDSGSCLQYAIDMEVADFTATLRTPAAKRLESPSVFPVLVSLVWVCVNHNRGERSGRDRTRMILMDAALFVVRHILWERCAASCCRS